MLYNYDNMEENVVFTKFTLCWLSVRLPICRKIDSFGRGQVVSEIINRKETGIV